MIFIFIGGASGSGKTGLSAHILSLLGKKAQLLSMDDYYKEIPKGVLAEAYRLNTNFDTPEMLHLDLFKKHLMELNKGCSITKPIFDFKTNTRKGEKTVNPSEVLIIEGIFAQYFYKNFWFSECSALTINIATDNYLDIVERRIKRDKQCRDRERSVCLIQERKYVGPGFLKYTAHSAIGSDVYVSNEQRETQKEQNDILEAAAKEVVARLKRVQEGDLVTKQPSAPNIQEMVAKSHFIAGTLSNPLKFEGYFNGVFGHFKGNFIKEFPEEEPREDKTCSF